MGKIKIDEIENYQEKMQGGFFALKNDKDFAKVRFLYETMEDIPVYAVHEIEVDGKKKYVNCLRSFDEPVENCPLCMAKYKLFVKFFLQLFDETEEVVKVWDRGVTVRGMLEGLCTRYNPLVSVPVEIERSGKAGDTKTTYTPYPLAQDESTLESFPEKTELIGTLILDKTVVELKYFLDHGAFLDTAPRTETATAKPVMNRGAIPEARTAPAQRQATTPQRRVPGNPSAVKGDVKF